MNIISLYMHEFKDPNPNIIQLSKLPWISSTSKTSRELKIGSIKYIKSRKSDFNAQGKEWGLT